MSGEIVGRGGRGGGLTEDGAEAEGALRGLKACRCHPSWRGPASSRLGYRHIGLGWCWDTRCRG